MRRPEHVGTFAGRDILRARESGVPGNVPASGTSATIFGQVWSSLDKMSWAHVKIGPAKPV